MKAFIRAISSISLQASFRSDNVYAELKPISADSDVVAPDYKEFIEATSLRRLSPILRMGLTASKECQAAIQTPFDSISVGTALGCLKDTEKFLVTFNTTTSDFLSPTAFIQSTHNTIGGQISLGLGNHAYNMTHTQNSLSFEVAMVDGLLCIEEGKKNVLVGAAEEKIPFLKHLQPTLISDDYPLSSGATFFALSPEKDENSIEIRGVYTNFNSKNITTEIEEFLRTEGLSLNELALILSNELLPLPEEIAQINYLEFTGLHYSASSFAVHIGHDYLRARTKGFVLVVNTLCKGKLGLTLLERT
ncbi:MAG: hypothetical protein A3D92_13015 [Bacteroidetes bacterium RIFCSPHIGHO2_02_FULL_44_7]|nr:MAG: hypothetical protein A3D92_13015 [Bacteroidetes bacterium RIFCSPHIGHO2_02_FULL_44_7]